MRRGFETTRLAADVTSRAVHGCSSSGRTSSRSGFPKRALPWPCSSPGSPRGCTTPSPARRTSSCSAGTCLLVIEEQERHLRAWDFVHCPAGTHRVFVGTGDGPCVLFMTGARRDGRTIDYPVLGARARSRRRRRRGPFLRRAPSISHRRGTEIESRPMHRRRADKGRAPRGLTGMGREKAASLRFPQHPFHGSRGWFQRDHDHDERAELSSRFAFGLSRPRASHAGHRPGRPGAFALGSSVF